MRKQNLGVIVFACIFFSCVSALPVPQEDLQGEAALSPPSPGSKPGSLGWLPGAEEDDTTVSDPEPGGEPATEKPFTLAPISEGTAIVPLTPPTVDVRNSKRTADEERCGPSCRLAHQTPIILLIFIIIVIILLLIILFGCYFMKKLHGKAIFTTAQRHQNILDNDKGMGYFSPEKRVETRTSESVIPGNSGERRVIRTATVTTTVNSSGDPASGPLRT